MRKLKNDLLTYVFIDKEPYVKKISFGSLKDGDVFYCEESNGELDCEDNGFIYYAKSDAYRIKLDDEFDTYCIRIKK